MHTGPNPSLVERISHAGSDICSAVMWSVQEERGVHLQTAIAASGYLTGTAILKNCGVNISGLQPGAQVFVDAVNETGTAVWEQIEKLAGGEDLNTPPMNVIPQEHQPRQTYEASVILMWPQLEAILHKHDIPAESAPFACARALAQTIIEGTASLSPAVAKTIALSTLIKASKTVPPAPEPTPQTIQDREEFLRMLFHTLAGVDALATREPAYPVWHQLLQQLLAMRQWTANCSDPTREQCQRVSIGLIAVRELEPAVDAEMYDLIARLHELNYYWRHWREGTGPVPARKPIGWAQKGARMILLASGALLLVCLILLYAFRVKVPPGSPLGLPVQAGLYSATLVATMQPYLVSLRHNPESERYNVSLVLHPLDGNSADRSIALSGGFRAVDLQFGAKILGNDGQYLWIFVNEIKGLNLSTKDLIGAEELRRANPSLKHLPGEDNSNNPLISPTVHRIDRANNDIWNGENANRRFSFGTRLRVTTPDFNHVLEIDPESLKTTQIR